MEIKKSLKIPKVFECEFCDYTTGRKQDYDSHLLTLKHKRKILESRNLPTDVGEKTYNCIHCNYSTLKKKDYEKHEKTVKHLKTIDPNNCVNIFNCQSCNKQFANSSGLWKHKQKCKANNDYIKDTQNTNITNEMFIEFMKHSKEIQQFLYEQNKELQNTLIEKTSEFQNTMIDQNNKILELSKNPSTMINSNNTTNQQFNIQFFLNETCKDAMNITDFVNSLQLQIEDFETTGKLGYIEGISRIIINGLRRIDTTKRPIHCTDVKRETLYVKDEDTWEKEEPEKTKLKRAVNQVARMNLSQLPKWQKENPESEILDTKENNEYIKYSLVALGGKDQDEDDRFVEKIMKNVLKEVIIDKNNHLLNR
jgi:hypothetical protein